MITREDILACANTPMTEQQIDVAIRNVENNDWLMLTINECIEDAIYYALREKCEEQKDESDMKADMEEIARILDYIGLDYKHCTMDSNFCDYAQAFVERLVNKYQTHRAE